MYRYTYGFVQTNTDQYLYDPKEPTRVYADDIAPVSKQFPGVNINIALAHAPCDASGPMDWIWKILFTLFVRRESVWRVNVC